MDKERRQSTIEVWVDQTVQPALAQGGRSGDRRTEELHAERHGRALEIRPGDVETYMALECHTRKHNHPRISECEHGTESVEYLTATNCI